MKKLFLMIFSAALIVASCSKDKSTITDPGFKPEIKPEAKVGYYYYGDGSYSAELKSGKTPIGIVFWLNSGNKSGKIVSLKEPTGNAGGLALDGEVDWMDFNHGSKIGASSNIDGKANMESVKTWIASSENVDAKTMSDFPAFKWCVDYPVVGKEEWYLPAETEIRQLYAAMSGLKLVDSGAAEGEINDWGLNSEMPNYNNYVAERAAFNALFTAPGVGGMALYPDAYWSSTERSATNALDVNCGSGLSQDDNKFAIFHVRAIATF